MSSELQDSIVLITSKDSTNNHFGTGFVIFQDKSMTYLLTCAHVVDDVGGADHITAGGTTASVIASGVKENPDLDVYYPADLAVLRVETLLDQPVLNLRLLGQKGTSFTTAGFQTFSKAFLIRPLQGMLGEQVGLEAREAGIRVRAWDLKINDDYGLKPGYSGSPVVDKARDSVVAVVSHRQGETKGVAISVKALTQVWPNMPTGLSENLKSEQGEEERRMSDVIVSQQRRRIGRTYQRIQDEWNLYNGIIERLRASLAGMPEGLPKIQLEKEIKDQESHLKSLEEELNKLECESE